MRGEAESEGRIIYSGGRSGEDRPFVFAGPDAVHAFHTRPFFGLMPIIIQNKSQDPRVHNPTSPVSSRFAARLRFSGHRLRSIRLIPPRKPLCLLVDVVDTFRGRRVECLHLRTEGRVQCARVVLCHDRQHHMGTNNGRSPYVSNLLRHPLLFVERPGLADAAAHAGLNFSGDGLVRPESLLPNSRIYRVNEAEETC